MILDFYVDIIETFGDRFSATFDVLIVTLRKISGKSTLWTNTGQDRNFQRTLRAIGPYLFLGKFIWTNHWSIPFPGESPPPRGHSYGPMVLKVFPKKFPPTLVLVHGWLFPEHGEFAENIGNTSAYKNLFNKRSIFALFLLLFFEQLFTFKSNNNSYGIPFARSFPLSHCNKNLFSSNGVFLGIANGGVPGREFSNSWTCCVFFAWKSVIARELYLKSTLRLLLRRRVWGQICCLKNLLPKTPHSISQSFPQPKTAENSENDKWAFRPHENKGFAPPTPENDENGGCHARKDIVC